MTNQGFEFEQFRAHLFMFMIVRRFLLSAVLLQLAQISFQLI